MNIVEFKDLVSKRYDDNLRELEKSRKDYERAFKDGVKLSENIPMGLLEQANRVDVNSYSVQLTYPANNELMKEMIALAAGCKFLTRYDSQNQVDSNSMKIFYRLDSEMFEEMYHLDLVFGSYIEGSTCNFIDTGETKEQVITRKVFKMVCNE